MTILVSPAAGNDDLTLVVEGCVTEDRGQIEEDRGHIAEEGTCVTDNGGGGLKERINKRKVDYLFYHNNLR